MAGSQAALRPAKFGPAGKPEPLLEDLAFMQRLPILFLSSTIAFVGVDD
jgi:hypothetical protein